MNTFRSAIRPICTSIAIATVGVLSLPFTTDLVAKHIDAIAQAREVSAPLIASLPNLERKKDVLRQQVELADLHSALEVGSDEERIHAYVVPREFDLDRLLSFFDVLREHLIAEGLIASMSPVEFDQPRSINKQLDAVSVRVSFATTEEGMHDIVTLVRLAGLLTVSDALTDADRKVLFDETESENPAGITALESFLSTDILEYALEPRSIQAALERSFSSPNFDTALYNVLRSPLLQNAQSILGSSFGYLLKDHELWPLPFMMFNRMSVEDGNAPGWKHLSLELEVYRRKI